MARTTGPRAVLVTGGGTGIGAAVARQLTAAGDQVAILGRRPDVLAAVAASTGATDVVCDVSDAGQVAACVEAVAGRFGKLDGLVLNAGVMVPGGVASLTAADWDTLISVNLTGAFLMAKAALPHLLRRRGAVVSVASTPGSKCGATPPAPQPPPDPHPHL
jgi:NAD(P)-dependent dehydrogenase (short-subunit alcohol dehydrogenase family)